MYKYCFLLLFALIITRNYCFAETATFEWSKVAEIGTALIGKTNDIMFITTTGTLRTPINISKDNGITWESFFSNGQSSLPGLGNARIVNKKDSKGIFLYCANNTTKGIVYTDFEIPGYIEPYLLDFYIREFDCDKNHNAAAIGRDSTVYLSTDIMISWKKIFKDDEFSPFRIFIFNENSIGFLAEKQLAERMFETKYFYTNNAGDSWQDVDLPACNGYNVRFHNLEFISDKVGYITGNGQVHDTNYSSSVLLANERYDYVLKTIDGGQTWNKILDSTIVLEARDSSYGKIMPHLYIYDEETLIVYGRELYYTTDGGQTWSFTVPTYENREFGIRSAFLNNKNQIYGIAYIYHTGLFVGNIYSSIIAPQQLISLQVYPNPTNELTTISLELETAGDVKIVLSDVLGQELLQIYDGFATAGTFTKTFTTENLSRGVYFLKILSGKNFTVEKIVVN